MMAVLDSESFASSHSLQPSFANQQTDMTKALWLIFGDKLVI
jgi:hypothetical protein